MPVDQEEAKGACSRCGLEVPERDLHECSVCHVQCCPYCVIHDFGRSFCSNRCRGFFFWGESDQEEQVD